MRNTFVVSVMTMMLVVTAAADKLTDAQYQKLKNAALNRPRHNFLSNDGGDARGWKRSVPLTKENFWNVWLNAMRGKQIDVLAYTPGEGLHMNLLTNKKNIYYRDYDKDKNAKKRFNPTDKLLNELHTDTLTWAAEFCRKNNFEIFLTIRINDIHDALRPFKLPELKKKRPGLLCGSRDNQPAYGAWSAYNFALKEVRDLYLKTICKAMEHYDIDGLDIDFLRWPVIFKSVAWNGRASDKERAIATRFIADIHAAAERIGRAKGHPILIAVRVPDSPEFCKEIGLDIEQWMSKGLVDMVFSGGDKGNYEPYQTMIALGKKYNVKVYPTVETPWCNNSGVFARGSSAGYNGLVYSALTAGASGIYYFNFTYAPGHYSSMSRNPDDYKFRDKRYFARYDQDSYACGLADEKRFNKIPLILPKVNHEVFLAPGQEQTFKLNVGDNFSAPEVLAANPSLRLSVNAVPSNSNLEVKVNGGKLEKPLITPKTITFKLKPSQVKKGLNSVSLRNISKDKSVKMKVIMSGRELLYKEKQAPWRRLFRRHYTKGHPELIENGAYRITDSGKKANEYGNLIYPIPAVPDNGLTAEFEMKLQYSTAPDAVVFRITDGETVENILFQPRKISLQYARMWKTFITNDKFHKYKVILRNKEIQVFADSKKILTAKTQMKNSQRKSWLKGMWTTIPLLHTRPLLLLGSLSGPGTGSALWKNVKISQEPVICCRDIVLNVTYNTNIDPKLDELAVKKISNALLSVSAKDVIPSADGKIKSVYKKLPVKSEKGVDFLFLDNRDNVQKWQRIYTESPQCCASDDKYLVIQWRCRPGVLSPKLKYNFSAIFCPGKKPGANNASWSLVFSFAPGFINTLWGNIPVPKGWLDCSVALNKSTGAAVFFVNGRKVIQGTANAVERKPHLSFGDSSSHVGGTADLEFFKIKSYNGK